MNIRGEIEKIKEEGYNEANAEARLCQDIILAAIAGSSLKRNVTIKGGVVMRNLSGSVRRATQDLDLDFIRYSISDESIEAFIRRLNEVSEVTLQVILPIKELNHQDYKGKRVMLDIYDEEGNRMSSKIDIGVHKDLDIEQEEYCFDVCFQEEGASLLMNSREQIMAEKVKSMLRFGVRNTRYKDIYDICYLKDGADSSKLKTCLNQYIFEDKTLQVNTMPEMLSRLENIFSDESYVKEIDRSKKNWLGLPTGEVIKETLTYFRVMK